MNKQLFKSVMKRGETWPQADQEDLLDIALEFEARREQLSPEELAGIGRGRRDAEVARFAIGKQVEVVFAKLRRL